ncbi:MAG TPA: YihY/virulence factor BrkB family protein [Cytophagaceae bacterium]
MIMQYVKRTFKWKDLGGLVKDTYKDWSDDDCFRKAASLAYYSVFSLPGLLMIIITIAGVFLGQQAIEGQLSQQISGIMGESAARQVETIIKNSQVQSSSIISTVIGVAILVFGATAVLVELKKSLNEIWEIKTNPNAGILQTIIDRVSGLILVLFIGALLLATFVITAAISVLSEWITNNLGGAFVYLFHVANFLVSLGVMTVLFALMYKFFPDVRIGWKSVWVGALITSILFAIGKFGLGIYFGMSNPGSAYGAAGSMILILLFAYYSALILFFGAEFTQVYANKYGQRIEPSKSGVWIDESRNTERG